MKKSLIIFLIGLVVATSLFFLARPGQSANKSYYSGDAFSFGDQLYVATTNTGSLEVFRLEGQELSLLGKIRPYDARFNKYGDFYDAKLVSENSRLYVYAVSEYTIYKYEVSGRSLSLVKQDKNTYWEWYNRIDKFGDRLVTVSAKGIKVWNSDLQVVDSYDFQNASAPYNLSGDQRYFLSVDNENQKLNIYDRESRQIAKSVALNLKYEKGNRRAAIDNSGAIYVVDDYYAKKYSANGKLLGSFRHLDYQGFDIALSGHSDNVYFSNGVGVVKLGQDMSLKDYAWTGNLGGKSGWAMGLESVYAAGEKVVVFNNTNILVLDSNLNKIASVAANEAADESYPLEDLFLRLDKMSAAENSSIAVSGGGFQPSEKLEITLAGSHFSAQADYRGRFSSVITVPKAKAGAYDIEVSGTDSARHYSISFRIE
jgi:hypothetical protein